MRTVKGRPCVLFTTKDYSITTSGHKSNVRNAIRADATIIFTDNVLETVPGLIADLKQAVNEAIQAIPKATTTLREYKAIIESESKKNEYDHLCIIAGRKPVQFKGFPDDAQRTNARQWLKERDKELEVKRQERWKNRAKIQAEREERQRLKMQEDVEKWLAGENIKLGWHHGETRLRLSADKTMIETSKGVEFPTSHGVMALGLIRRGQEWHKNGQSLRFGTFFADSIDAEGNVTAGCHKVSRAEIERVAAQLGV